MNNTKLTKRVSRTLYTINPKNACAEKKRNDVWKNIFICDAWRIRLFADASFVRQL
jgi:hypothetical protein